VFEFFFNRANTFPLYHITKTQLKEGRESTIQTDISSTASKYTPLSPCVRGITNRTLLSYYYYSPRYLQFINHSKSQNSTSETPRFWLAQLCQASSFTMPLSSSCSICDGEIINAVAVFSMHVMWWQRVPETRLPDGYYPIKRRVWDEFSTRGYVIGQNLIPIGYGGYGCGCILPITAGKTYPQK
jgi:hypothetical protein